MPRPIPYLQTQLPRFLSHVPSLIAAVLCSGCAGLSAFDAGLQPFTTDGCSMFPDRSYISKADWCSCCVAHDLAYWRGGTAEQRRQADLALKDCVQKATKNPFLANMMYEGVRVGGGPYLFTTYRWAYGWKVGRGYFTLTTEENAEADRLAADYLATNPQLKCGLGSKNPACLEPTSQP
ncbi:hypothetical protein H8K35_03660 [Undibacterium sp. LX40W]|uniref:Uncharacterized protein n=1 Tax=Undibacterium nitidum TaxID=2762298 RepID=A0A923KK87_9BURK|nr:MULTISPECIES: hypothetical protein [Undibacterium]MBC3880515.1 hypothetical protein [Undibacterium nitidum]MBC3890749.1 hypothetical protein [Undibacterium sp. LX40W]